MSVVVGDRKESKYEPVWNAVVLSEKITDLCIRRFGIKDLDHMVRRKYEYPNSKYCDKNDQIAMIQEAKSTMIGYVDHLIANTRIAYKQREKKTLESCDLQIKCIEESIMYCELMVGKIQNIIMIFNVDLNIYRPYVNDIDREICLLKKWRRRVKNSRRKILKQG